MKERRCRIAIAMLLALGASDAVAQEVETEEGGSILRADEWAVGGDTAELFERLRRARQAAEAAALAEVERPHPSSRYNTEPPKIQEHAAAWRQGVEPPPTIQIGTKEWAAYGVEEPELRCTQARACGVQLEPGEIVHHVQLGDDTHWVVEQGVVGDPDEPAEIVYFSPRLAEIATNAFISTTRRLYTLGLISPSIADLKRADTHYTRVLRFYYPDGGRTIGRPLEEVRRIERERAAAVAGNFAATQKSEASETHQASTQPQNIRTQYTWKSKPKNLRWSPTAVWDDGERLYIQLPDDYDGALLPALVVETAGADAVANHHYDVVAKRFVVHQLVDEAELVVRKNRNIHAKVTIRRADTGRRLGR